MLLKSTNNVYLYYQIQNIIREEIISGKYKPGDHLPSQKVLENKFKVSRITIRKALGVLVENGLIERRQGRSALVKALDKKKFPDRLIGNLDYIHKTAKESKAKIIGFNFVKPTLAAKKSLELKDNEISLCVKKLRFKDKEPFVYIIDYIRPDLGKKVSIEDMEQHTLTEILEIKHNIFITSGYQTIFATIADQTLASHLNIQVGAPLIRIERILYSKQKPTEFIIINYRADRFAIGVKLERSSFHSPGFATWAVKRD